MRMLKLILIFGIVYYHVTSFDDVIHSYMYEYHVIGDNLSNRGRMRAPGH